MFLGISGLMVHSLHNLKAFASGAFRDLEQRLVRTVRQFALTSGYPSVLFIEMDAGVPNCDVTSRKSDTAAAMSGGRPSG